MANDLLNAVSDLDLPPSQKAVLIALANRTGKTTRICFPSIARICKDTSLSRRTVFYALRALESAGLLLRIGKPGNRSKYRVLVEPMTQIQRSAPVQALHGRVRQGGVISAVAVGHRQAALAVMCRG